LAPRTGASGGIGAPPCSGGPGLKRKRLRGGLCVLGGGVVVVGEVVQRQAELG
jgi:hypothetical protein